MEKSLNTGPLSSKTSKVNLKHTAKLTYESEHLELTDPTSSGESVT